MRAVLLASLAVLGSGCATMLSGAGARPKLPYEARVWLLDAEEDLMTARARAEEAEREVARAKSAANEAEERRGSLVGSKLERGAKGQVALTKARLQRSERSHELLAAAATCAERRYEAARAKAEVKFKIEGADESESQRLSDRADGCEARLTEKQQALGESEEQYARAAGAAERESEAEVSRWVR